MPEAFPWVRFLPTEEVRAFVLELVSALRAPDAVENPAPVVQVISAWRSTAEIHADPELAAILSTDGSDHGPVPQPPNS
jgi:MoxR-like ATPase